MYGLYFTNPGISFFRFNQVHVHFMNFDFICSTGGRKFKIVGVRQKVLCEDFIFGKIAIASYFRGDDKNFSNEVAIIILNGKSFLELGFFFSSVYKIQNIIINQHIVVFCCSRDTISINKSASKAEFIIK